MPLAIQLILASIGPMALSRFKEQCRTPMSTQEHLLSHVVRSNRDTLFGQRHGFKDIVSVGEFKKRVPIFTYDDLFPYIDAEMHGTARQLTHQRPMFYATTSGTTGSAKFIPVTLESRSAKSQLVRLLLYSLYRNHPAVFSGKILMVISPEVHSYAPSGIPCGSESGHMYRNMPKAMNAMYAIPYEVCEIQDYNARYYTLLRIAAGESLSLIFACNPSTVLLLADRLAQYSEHIIKDVRNGTLGSHLHISSDIRSLIERQLIPNADRAQALDRAAQMNGGRLTPSLIWPDLKVIACWKGGTVGTYLERFDQYFSPNVIIRDVGYLSSEHRGSVALSDEGDGGVLAVPTNFFEFFPVEEGRNPRPLDLLTVDELEVGKQYYIYVTTLAGLYRYDMNDIVEVIDTFERTPIIRFVQKGKGVASFTGEKLTETQVLSAISETLEPLRGRYDFIAAVGEMMGSQPGYAFLVEFDELPSESQGKTYARRLEHALCSHNCEYGEKRNSHRLQPALIRAVRRGEFDLYRKRMVEQGRSDGQFKILRITTDKTFATAFHTEREYDCPPQEASQEERG